ncbi:SMC-Scp complex subunit ScpB [Methylocella tundrae]|uniref:Segregation and condensation protein B n=1 Tax=Methylocella tundrae TaxID=227605 RepID=A0A4U8YXC4_METTU|nr:SMC-Scp complex subunit ScpB [Methylocella tundrae]WPP05543.1 SMC-Scp complex subunit ScpB [Methylocella tundrae]VFU07979.1 Segregation and condensation protein B [Methylocella tundrae]
MTGQDGGLVMGEIARLFPASANGGTAEPAEAHQQLTEAMRIAEALLFAAPEPLAEEDIEKRLPRGVSAKAALDHLKASYSGRGVNLVRVGGKWMFRTATDLAWLLAGGEGEQKRMSRAALETLAIIAYHQPVTRAEIEDIRGVAISKGTLDVLLETGWVRLRGRRRAPGRPITYGTTTNFLIHFGLEAITDLPGLEELKGAGLFDGRLPSGFAIPQPSDDDALCADEDPLEADGAAEPDEPQPAASDADEDE